MPAAEAKREAEMNHETSDRSILNRRKSSLSNTLIKMASTTFSHCRTTSNMPPEDVSSVHAACAILKRPPSRIPRRNSIFGSLTSKSLVSDKENIEHQPAPPRKSHRTSDRPSQNAFFNTQAHDHSVAPPLVSQHPRRESKTHIAERKLMAPIPPPLPRSSTMPIQQLSSQSVPSFMRPTSSSTARMSDVALIRNIGTVLEDGPSIPTPPKNRKPRASIGHPGGAQRRTSSSRLLSTPITGESEPATLMPSSRKASLTASRARFNETLTTHLLHVGEVTRTSTPVVAEESGSDSEPTIATTPCSGAANPRQIHTAQPGGYWAGRVSALSDRFRTEALSTASFSSPLVPSTIDAYEETRANGMHDDARRMRRVFIHLKSLCTTEEAKESLEAFKKAYDARMERGDTLEKEVKKTEKDKDKKGVWEKLVRRKRVKSMT